jgi:hypothetical protein
VRDNPADFFTLSVLSSLVLKSGRLSRAE